MKASASAVSQRVRPELAGNRRATHWGRRATQRTDTEEARVACDSLVALGDATVDGAALLAKNSDRPATECQPLTLLSGRKHPPGARLQCQYIDIAQVPETARVLGSRPFWLWGFEHGVNEHGVAIGNHTVFTRDAPANTGLTGMDLVRLGLERGRSASHAVQVITELIERHGQGGSGFLHMDWPYHNSFLIADRREAYLVETSARQWAVRQVRSVGSATNHLTIGRNWDRLSPQAVEHAAASGWWPIDSGERFDFAAAYRDASIIPDVISIGRYARTCRFLAESVGSITPASLMTALRDHYGGPMHPQEVGPDQPEYYAVCMHAEPIGTTTASMVARLPSREEEPVCYWGSFGSPCIGVFVPYYIDGALPAAVSRGGADPDDESTWWRFRRLLSLVEEDPEPRGRHARRFWDEFERAALVEATAVEEEASYIRRKGDLPRAARLLADFTRRRVEEMHTRLQQLLADLARLQ